MNLSPVAHNGPINLKNPLHFRVGYAKRTKTSAPVPSTEASWPDPQTAPGHTHTHILINMPMVVVASAARLPSDTGF